MPSPADHVLLCFPNTGKTKLLVVPVLPRGTRVKVRSCLRFHDIYTGYMCQNICICEQLLPDGGSQIPLAAEDDDLGLRPYTWYRL